MQQARQVLLDCFPDYAKINFEVAVHEHVSHFVGERKREFRVIRDKAGVRPLDKSAGLADDFKVTDHRILRLLILREPESSISSV